MTTCNHDWKKDTFGPWVCKVCGTWSVTELQAESLRKRSSEKQYEIRRDQESSK